MSVPLSEDDRANAQFAIGVELAARDLYRAAIEAGATGTAWAILASQHAQYAQRVAALTGISANTADNTLYEARVANFQGDRPANAAYDLENTLVATHAELLTQLLSPDAANVLASIVTMESTPGRLPGRAFGPRQQLRRPVHLYRHPARAGGDAASRLTRREALQSSGVVLAFGVVAAACASNEAGGDAGRVGSRPRRRRCQRSRIRPMTPR